MEVLKRLEDIRIEAVSQLKEAQTDDEIEQIRINYLGREGEVTLILRKIGDLPQEQRADVGRLGNQVKNEIENGIEKAKQELADRKRKMQLKKETVDVTAPGKRSFVGRPHPLTQTRKEVLDILIGMGFSIETGPEIETDWHNFTGLNIPPDHPARDMQDSFYITDNLVLRTQTSPIQLRHMRKVSPELPVRIVGPGRVFRRGDDDVSHSPVFHQCEALFVDEGVNFGHLRGTLMEFAQKLFGEKVQVRFRPSYFPFTEPSAEVDVSCTVCDGSGCSTCSYTGFLEILGAGMVHPQVLENGGYDPEKVSGFAFGIGMDRLAMLKYDIPDIRYLYHNDVRFLRQL